jgi:hypothetical protein
MGFYGFVIVTPHWQRTIALSIISMDLLKGNGNEPIFLIFFFT